MRALWRYGAPLFGGCLLLFGCQEPWYLNLERPSLPERVQGTSDREMIVEMEQLRRHDVKVVTVGQQYLVAIPAVRLFPRQSPRIRWGSYATLNEVVAFLKQFRKIAVTVTAYSDSKQPPDIVLALNRARAASVANYLWSQGIDSRLLFVVGARKACGPVVPAGERAAMWNERIEITFQDAIL